MQKFFLASTIVGIDIVRNRDARTMYLSLTALIDRLHEPESDGITHRENLTRNYLHYNPGQAMHMNGNRCVPVPLRMTRRCLIS